MFWIIPLGESDAAGVLARLRSVDAYQHIRVVVYSTALSPSRQKELLAMGVVACYEKGNNMEELIAVATQLKDLGGAKTS